MKFSKPIPIKMIAEKIGAEILGDSNLVVTGINEIHKAEKGDIIFVDVKKYFKASLDSAASIIILNEPTDCPKGKALLLCDKPFEAYNNLVKEYNPFRPLTANISESAQIHPSTIIEPNVVIGHDVKIGKNGYIQANTTIYSDTIIGDNVIIQSGTIIGTDAFYFKSHLDRYEKWHSGGRVIIEDDVQIGAGCTINKGVSGDTIIGQGSKLDCQVHLGHGVVIGRHCLLAGQVGIGGKTVIGDRVVLYGQVGIMQNLTIGDEIVVHAKSGIMKNLESGKVYFGYPAKEAKTMYRELIAQGHLPGLLKEFNTMKKKK